MNGGALSRLVAMLLAAVLLLAACAPHTAPAGGQASDPEIAGDHFVTRDGLKLPMRRWMPESTEPWAVVLGLHGFNDYSGAFSEPAEAWRREGVIVYAYDQRGFGASPYRGLWSGTETLVRDLVDAARSLKARHPDLPLFVMGESMGAAVILATAALGYELPADGAVLLAPAVWARKDMPVYQRAALWLAAHVVPWASFTGENLDVQASDNIAALRALALDPMVLKESRVEAIYGLVNLMDTALAAAPDFEQPALVLYGEKDEIIPPEPVLDLWRTLPEDRENAQRRVLYRNGWHLLLRDLQAGTVRRDILHWMRHPSEPLPSEADMRAASRLLENTS